MTFWTASHRWSHMSLFGLAVMLCLVVGCEPPGSPEGVLNVFGEPGMGPGGFSYPRAIAVSDAGKIYVVDKTARIQRFDSEGEFELQWRMPEWQAGKPVGLSVAPDGRVFVADTHYGRVVVFDPDGKELARFGSEGTGEGEFLLPTDVAFDSEGRIYVGEYNGNDRVTRWRADYSFDRVLISGVVSGEVMRRPACLVIDDEETLWVADAVNHRILRFDLDGQLMSSFGELGRGVGQLRYPYDIAIDDAGRLLVCEYGNCRLQRFDTEGRSLGVWGRPGRAVGELHSPWGAAVGPGGRVYVVDSVNGRIQVLRWP